MKFKYKSRVERILRRIRSFTGVSIRLDKRTLVQEDCCLTKFRKLVVIHEPNFDVAQCSNIKLDQFTTPYVVKKESKDQKKLIDLEEEEFLESFNQEELSFMFSSAVNAISDRSKRIGENGLIRTGRLADLFNVVQHVEPIVNPLNNSFSS